MKFGLTEQQYQYIQETLENGNFPYKVDIVQSKDFAESYRESFERDKVEI